MVRTFLTRRQWLNLASTGVRAGAAVGVQKIVALRYGPPGVLELGQYLLLQALCYALLTDGLNRAMMVEAGQAGSPGSRMAVLAKGGMAAALLMAAVALLAWMGIPYLLPGSAALALPMALAIGAGGWAWWVAASLQFEDFPAAVFAISLAQGIIMLAGAALPDAWMPAFLPDFPNGPTGDLPNRLLLISLGLAVFSLILGSAYQLALRRKAASQLGESMAGLWQKVGAYGGLSLAVLLAGRGADVLVRAYAMQLGYWHELGLWQAAVRLGEVVFVPFTPLFTFVFFAHAAQMTDTALAEALRPQLRLALAGTLGIGLIALLAPWALSLLNRADFTASAPYYYRQVPGDVLRLLALPISVALLAAGRIRTAAWLEGVSLAAYLLAIFAFSSLEGTLGLSTAHSFRYLIFFGATAYAARDLLFPTRQPASNS